MQSDRGFTDHCCLSVAVSGVDKIRGEHLSI